ncbi:hypothetical protein [Streptomyces sp. NPDC057250]|uniref:hypothetical protein n=1 Tax=Streptomyces sp. NPDC057250 TaxID=3346068 RepID=UPI00364502EC
MHSDPTPRPMHQLPCPAVRLTPYDRELQPDHARAYTYWFTEPPTLFQFLPDTEPDHRPFTREPLYRAPAPAPLAALLAPADHTQRSDLTAIALTLDLESHGHIALDVWSPHPDGSGWTHLLFPNWRALDPGEWPYEHNRDYPLYCLGRTSGSPSDWTCPMPGSAGYAVHTGITTLVTATATPPPPPGRPHLTALSTLSPDTVRATGGTLRTPIRAGEDTHCFPTIPTSRNTQRTPPDTHPQDTRHPSPDTTPQDTGRTPPGQDTPDTGRTPGDTPGGQGVRFAYQTRVPRHLAGAALTEAFALLARAKGEDSPPPTPAADPEHLAQEGPPA